MSDLEQLTEALAEWKDPEARPLSNVDGMTAIIQAAAAYRDLLANGQRVEWCVEHQAMDVGFHVVEGVCPVAAGFRREQNAAMGRIVTDPSSCRFVSKLLSVYPKEAENE